MNPLRVMYRQRQQQTTPASDSDTYDPPTTPPPPLSPPLPPPPHSHSHPHPQPRHLSAVTNRPSRRPPRPAPTVLAFLFLVALASHARSATRATRRFGTVVGVAEAPRSPDGLFWGCLAEGDGGDDRARGGVSSRPVSPGVVEGTGTGDDARAAPTDRTEKRATDATAPTNRTDGDPGGNTAAIVRTAVPTTTTDRTHADDDPVRNTTTIVSEAVPEPSNPTDSDDAAPVVPSRLVFTYRTDLWTLAAGDGAGLGSLPISERVPASNVRNTVERYRTAGGGNDGVEGYTVVFLTDQRCWDAVRDAEPELVEFFDGEGEGKFRADICRIAELYLNGGYYFDVDLEVIHEPYLLPQNLTFATVLETTDYGASGFFQAFIASTKRHPVLRYALDAMLAYYRRNMTEEERRTAGSVGPVTLKIGYDRYVEEESGRRRTVSLLREDRFNEELRGRYAGVKPQEPSTRNSGWGCNYIVHDGERPYFFSRVKGAKRTNDGGPGCWR